MCDLFIDIRRECEERKTSCKLLLWKMGLDKHNSETEGMFHNMEIKLYARRWFQLVLFMMFSSTVSVHWMQFSSITNIVSRYYNVSRTLVEYTSIMCMAARAFILFPALFLIDKLETRKTLILAGTLCLTGSCIKTFSVSPEKFYLALIGQVFNALGLVFTYSLIGRFSAAWFSADEISRAGALSCVGDIIGSALGFLLPTRFVPDSKNDEEIENGMQLMHYCYTTWDAITLILLIIFFKSKPKRPPSAAQVHNRSNKSQRVYESVKQLFSNLHFLLFLTSVGLFVGGGCNAIGTLLNEMIDTNFPGHTEHTGNLGCLGFVSGIIGSIVLGYIQDRTKYFKCNAVTVSVANCVSIALFTIALKSQNIVFVYVTYAIYGFFINGYYSTVIQMGIELSFPIPEGITVATISVSVEIVSMTVTALYGLAMKRYGDVKSNICITIVLLLSTVLIILVPPNFKREELEKAAKSTESTGLLYGSEKKLVVEPSVSRTDEPASNC